MDPKLFLSLLICVLVLQAANILAVQLQAGIFMAGIKGNVTFSQTTVGEDITVTFDLDIPESSVTYDWSISRFPMNYDVKMRCSEDSIGSSIFPLVAGTVSQTTQTQSVTLPAPNVNLVGPHTLLGKSLLLKSGNIKACATILPIGDMETAVTHFRSVLGGTVVFRQTKNAALAETVIFVNLFHLDENKVMNYTWQIHANPTNESVLPENQCRNLGQFFQSGSLNGACGEDSHQNCFIGNLTAKLGPVLVGGDISSSRAVKTDMNLPLTGANSVLGKSLVIFDQDQSILACANIIVVAKKEVRVNFSNDGVTGFVHFQQESPFDPTVVNVNLTGLRSLAGGYHVHDYPVPQRMTMRHSVCGGAEVSGHWNPFAWDISKSPTAGTSTSDLYEVGDLSGKFGSLNDANERQETYVDWNLPLFGVNSIIGRCLVIHYRNGSRWICSNIGYPSMVRTAVAHFNYPVIGHILFRQMINEPWSDTSIYMKLNYADGTMSTINHNWHIHVSPYEGDFMAGDNRCSSAKGHYNPFSVNLTGDYATSCSPANCVRCEIGDLANKHRKLNIGTAEGKATKFFFTDVVLPLSGPLSIVGKSVVIHAKDAGGPRLACANIYLLEPVMAEVNQWSSDEVTGSVKFYQSSPYDETVVDIDVKGLNGKAGGYHVHKYPILPGAENPCSGDSVSGHFNPFNVILSESPPNQAGTMDEYEVGDMSGKYGSFTSNSKFTGKFRDCNLPLSGGLSIVGRSLVIHRADGSRWVCGNIVESAPSVQVYKAKATFKGDIEGFILLSQTMFADGRIGDTQLYVKLNRDDGTVMNNNTWGIHERPVQHGGDCSTTGKPYNPYVVNVANGYSRCSWMNPYRCAVGDLSGKQGPYQIGTGQQFFTDVNLPLADTFSVLGRSFVIQDSSGKRIACADILPVDVEYVHMKVSRPRPYFNKQNFMAAIAKAVRAPLWTVSVQVVEEEAGVSDDCMEVRAYFTGPHGSEMKTRLNQIMQKEPGQLGIYSPCPAAAWKLG